MSLIGDLRKKLGKSRVKRALENALACCFEE
jgi:hypothetical protein